MKRQRSRDPQALRCHCSRRPTLALVGVGRDGMLFLHQKVHKQGRIYGESVVTEGVVVIRCRECLRWTKVRIQGGERKVFPPTDDVPEAMKGGPSANACGPFPRESRL